MPSTITAKQAISTAMVVPIGRHPRVFPAGTEANHNTHGWVLIEDAHDNDRLVRWYDVHDVPPSEFFSSTDDEGNPIIEEQEITERREWVSIDELRRVRDPARQRPAIWQRLQTFGAGMLPISVIGRYVPPTSDKPTATGGRT
jgi:hypothetical protein